MLDALLGAAAVMVSLAVSLAVIWMDYGRPLESRGMVGLAATVVHLMLSLMLPAAIWVVYRPTQPLLFVGCALIFYWVSLIILVLAIISWLRSGARPSASSPGELNSRHEDRL